MNIPNYQTKCWNCGTWGHYEDTIECSKCGRNVCKGCLEWHKKHCNKHNDGGMIKKPA